MDEEIQDAIQIDDKNGVLQHVYTVLCQQGCRFHWLSDPSGYQRLPLRGAADPFMVHRMNHLVATVEVGGARYKIRSGIIQAGVKQDVLEILGYRGLFQVLNLKPLGEDHPAHQPVAHTVRLQM